MVVPIPTVRAPAAKNAPWPSDACPAYPMSSDSPVTTIAASTICMKNVTSDITIGIASATTASTAIVERVSRVDVRRPVEHGAHFASSVTNVLLRTTMIASIMSSATSVW